MLYERNGMESREVGEKANGAGAGCGSRCQVIGRVGGTH